MSLQKKIEDKLSQALKNKDKNVFPTLRLIVSAIKDALIESGIKPITEAPYNINVRQDVKVNNGGGNNPSSKYMNNKNN